MKTALAALALVVVGCNGHHRRSDSSWTVSPQGYHVCWVEQGSVAGGRFTADEAFAWHSGAVERAVKELAAKGIPEAEARARAKSVAYRLVDNHSFQVGDIFVCGQWLPQANTAAVCLYSQRTTTSLETVPAEAPKWTIRPSYKTPGVLVYGILEPGREFPALAHELGHALRGPSFEH